MAVSDAKIEACVEHYRRLVEKKPPKSLSQAPDAKLRRIVTRAGAKRRSPKLLAQLAQAFAEAGLTTYPSLTDTELSSEDRVYFLDSADPVKGLAKDHELFRSEIELQKFVFEYRDWFPSLRNLGLHEFDPQRRLESGRRVDFLCKKRGSRQLVAIELKVRVLDDRAGGQLQDYVDDLAAHAKKHDFDSAQLVVISGQPDKRIRGRVEEYGAKHGVEVKFLLYRIQMKLLAHP